MTLFLPLALGAADGWHAPAARWAEATAWAAMALTSSGS
jgi:hypothetical protein